jgi:hypothetical protein
MLMKKSLKITLIFTLSFLALAIYRFSQPKQLDSANLTSVKDTLSSSRLSYVGAVDTGTTADSSLLYVKTSGLPDWATSDNNHNLFADDTLRVGDNENDYVVVDIVDDASDNKVQLDSALSPGDVDEDDPVIATRSAQHTVEFTPVSQISDGYFRVRLKATASSDAGDSTNAHDGIPDADGFDFTANFQDSYVDCTNAGGGSASVEYSDDTNCPAGYVCALCSYSGNNTTATKSITIGTTAAAQQPINPAPSSTGATEGAAGTGGGYDTYDFYIDHLDSSYDVVDSTQGKIAVVESVRVTAIVEPSIEFQISGVSIGASACGELTDVTTTATAVPFGSATISDFVDAAQVLAAATNASSGYAITALESDELNLTTATGLDTSTNIPDTTCNATGCTASGGNEEESWTDADTYNGFGYSLDDDDGNVDTIEFEYDTGGSNMYRPFPNAAADDSAVQIMASTSETATQDCYVCYRLTVSSTQQAGTYENSVTYVATATF